MKGSLRHIPGITTDRVVRPNCAPTASASAAASQLRLLQVAAPWLCPLQLLWLECVYLFISRTHSTNYNIHGVLILIFSMQWHVLVRMRSRAGFLWC